MDRKRYSGKWAFEYSRLCQSKSNISRTFECNSSPRGLRVGLGLSSTMDCISGWSLTTISGGRSLLRICVVGSWPRVEGRSLGPSSPSLSVSDASPGTCHQPASQTDKQHRQTVVEEHKLSISLTHTHTKQIYKHTNSYVYMTTLVPAVAVWGAGMEVI